MTGRLPDFLIAGAAKSATTWLQNSLQGSAGVFLPDPEPHFFSRRYAQGIDSYARMFAPAPPGALIGEKSNSYLTTEGAETRIHRHIPEVRLVFQLRNPVERAYSDYCMLFRRGSVDDRIRHHLDPERAAGGRFLGDGCYADHLQRWFDLFGPGPILILLYEEIARDPGANLERLAAHIGLAGTLAPPIAAKVKDATSAAVPRRLRRVLAPLRPILDPIRHTAPVRALRDAVAKPHRYPPLDPVLRAEIAAFYRPQILRLHQMTGLNCTCE